MMLAFHNDPKINRYLVITPRTCYFIDASSITDASLKAAMWNVVRVVKWMVQP